jgi:hypothetical protein
MKTSFLFLLLIVGLFPAFAQEETLIDGPIENGGFGGPVLKIGSFNGETGLLVGGRGGWIINHSFIVGGGGYGLANNVNAKTLGPYGERYLNFGYGGLELEYVAHPLRLVNFSVQTLIGAGALSWRDEDVRVAMRDSNSDTFFIIEPTLHVTLNVTKYFRISGGMGYRFISGLTSMASTNADLSGPSGVLTFRFGKF